jgi:multiple sugar transport system ATP-binding protein
VADIEIRGATKRYDGSDDLAVAGIDLDVVDGELLVLVGPSGCGKSTLLRSIAGLEELTSGSILIAGRDVTHDAPRDRDVAMVFQNYALYPHLTVRRNIAYPLKLAKVPEPERDRRVEAMAETLHLTEVLDRKPSQLSGGQRQRVAMGRALVRHPKAFLMDEPLSNLDAKLRVEMRAEIARLQRALGVTTVYVTHDQVEAMTMGDRVAVLDRGRLQQLGAPRDLYDGPANLFVATFLGSPAMSTFPGTVVAADTGELALDLEGNRLPLDPAVVAGFPGLGARAGQQVVAGLRPEALGDAGTSPDVPGELVVEMGVELVEALGADLIVHGTIGASRAAARFGPRSTARPGDTAKVAVDIAAVHLFDAETGASLRGEG